jgi:hypothetical protein
MIKKFEQYIKENLEYTVGHNESEEEMDVYSGKPEYASEQITRSVVDGYIHKVESATGDKVVSVEGYADETDSNLSFELDSRLYIDIEYIFHPYRSKIHVTVSDENHSVIERVSGNDTDNDVHDMIKDIYIKHGLKDINYTHEIRLPQELFSNDPYFTYDSLEDEQDRKVVSFESEEAAQAWINSLKIDIIK